jgi:diacylglycerol kinase family enzyme
MASVGIEGSILGLRDLYRSRGIGGFTAYCMALFRVYGKDYVPPAAHIEVDGSTISAERLLTLIVTKQPFYGFGIKVVPHARFDDGKLHALCIPSGFPGALWGLASSLTVGNQTGQYETGETVHLSLDRPVALQTDGSRAWKTDRFTFTILPGALRIKH